MRAPRCAVRGNRKLGIQLEAQGRCILPQRHQQAVALPVFGEGEEHDDVLRAVCLELVVFARARPSDGVFAGCTLGDVDGVFCAHGGHGDEAARVGLDVGAKVDEFVLFFLVGMQVKSLQSLPSNTPQTFTRTTPTPEPKRAQ